MSVVIKKVLGATKKDIEDKKFNIWIGVSLNNSYFSKDNLREYIIYALGVTREDICVLIPERLQAINIEVRDRKTKINAHKKAWTIGDEKELEIRDIISSLPDSDKSRVHIARWHDMQTKYFEARADIVIEEFLKKSTFYKAIIDIVKDNIKNSPRRFSEDEVEKLAYYILYEIPIFINGSNYGGPKIEKRYECILYPGIGLLDDLLVDLHKGISFPVLSKKLHIHEKMIIAEAYVVGE